MTIQEAISQVDKLKPNSIGLDVKINWLSKLDGIIKQEIIDKHEGGDDIEFEQYTPSTNLNTELLAAFPHDDIYRWYLSSQIDMTNGETNKYNSDITMYNTAYMEFESWYNSNHMPKSNAIPIWY